MTVIVAPTQVNGSSTLKAELKLALIWRLPRMCGVKDEACSESIVMQNKTYLDVIIARHICPTVNAVRSCL